MAKIVHRVETPRKLETFPGQRLDRENPFLSTTIFLFVISETDLDLQSSSEQITVFDVSENLTIHKEEKDY
ncbi:MAG: hypothetical protein ACLQGU_00175 [bacterium]